MYSRNDGEPQQALFLQALETPGAYDAYVPERLNEAVIKTIRQ